MNNTEDTEYQIEDYTVTLGSGMLEIRYKEEDPCFREYFKAHYDVSEDYLETKNELAVIGDEGLPEQQLYIIQVIVNDDNTTCTVNNSQCHFEAF